MSWSQPAFFSAGVINRSQMSLSLSSCFSFGVISHYGGQRLLFVEQRSAFLYENGGCIRCIEALLGRIVLFAAFGASANVQVADWFVYQCAKFFAMAMLISAEAGALLKAI